LNLIDVIADPLPLWAAMPQSGQRRNQNETIKKRQEYHPGVSLSVIMFP